MNESLNNRSLSSARGESKPLPELPYGILWDVCAWCGSILEAHLGPAKDDGVISHGACRPCFAKQMGFAVVMLIPHALLYCCSFMKVVALV